MDRDEKLLAVLGSRLLQDQKKVGETAEAIRLRQSGEESVLTAIATSVSESLTQVLRWVYWWNTTEALPTGFTKSGLMVGLGESREEIMQVMDDLRAARVDFLTIGQYLQPTKKHAAIDRFWSPEEFKSLEAIARAKGFLMVSASPLTRSSYHADSDFTQMQAARGAAG